MNNSTNEHEEKECNFNCRADMKADKMSFDY